jgi:hypothetical protein
MVTNVLKPKIVRLPDYSEYIGKEFIVKEDFYGKKNEIDRPILTGVRFVIKKIKNSDVTIKITNSKEELEKLGMLEYDFKRVIAQDKRTIRTLKKVCKMWEDEPDKFIIDDKSHWNKERYDGDGRGHCINTGYYNIPKDHPDKYGMARSRDSKIKDDSIMTLDYKRTDGKSNIYSYQRGHNQYYSKECYKYMLMGEEVQLKDWENRIDEYKNWVFGWIFEKQEIKLSTLNKIKFDFYKKK